MARACRFQFHLGRFRTVFLALLLIAPASGTASAGKKAEHLYLLAGTSARGMYIFPVGLYVVPGGRLVTVRQVSASLFRVIDDLSGHLYVLNGDMSALSVIHERVPAKVDVIPSPPKTKASIIPPFSDSDDPTWGGIAGPGIPPGIVYANGDRPGPWRIVRVFANTAPGQPRVTESSWDLYRHLRYAGPGGGPYPTIGVGALIRGHAVVMVREANQSVLGPAPPFLPREAGSTTVQYEDRTGEHSTTFRGADILADTAHFFVFTAPLPSPMPRWPRTVYVLNKATVQWSVVKVPFDHLYPRLFGAWLATIVAEPNSQGRGSPGLENERAVSHADLSTSKLPNVRGEYLSNIFMPGKLLLQNLVNGRKITIDAGQQDSEVLDVRKDGSVIYRVNSEIFSARIEGDRLSAPKLVVKGDDVPEVHWVFWFKAGTEAQASASDIQTLFAQLRSRATSSEALKQLLKLGGENSAAREYVSEHLPNLIETSGGEVKTNAIQLAGDLKIKNAVPMLVSLLRHFSMVGVTDLAVTARLQNDPVAKALVQIGEPSVEPVTHVLERGNRQARLRAARILFNISSPAAIQALRSHIPKEKDPHLRQFIASHVGR